MQGSITLYNNARGFGFITAVDGQQYFFHITNFAKDGAPPVLGGRVSFDVGPAISIGKKLQAVRVHYTNPVRDAAAASVFAQGSEAIS